MNHTSHRTMIYKAAALLLSISAPATSAVGVAFSSMFHGNMAVLQRGVDVNVYGTGNNIQSQSLSPPPLPLIIISGVPIIHSCNVLNA